MVFDFVVVAVDWIASKRWPVSPRRSAEFAVSSRKAAKDLGRFSALWLQKVRAQFHPVSCVSSLCPQQAPQLSKMKGQ